MNVEVKPGVYIVAVSGGVDSVVLLDLLVHKKDLRLIVAHFDHGIREDSASDRQFVEQLANKYGLSFEYAEGNLGPKVSEATARTARYNFLHRVRGKYQADAIITAHHQDDLLETILLNLLRGTGRKGITSLGDTGQLMRPLLFAGKNEITKYAQKRNLKWREDSTNADTSYLRNKIRAEIIPKLSKEQRQELLSIHGKLKKQNKEIDELLSVYTDSTVLNKKDVILFAHNIAKELVAAWLRNNNLKNFDQKTIERIVLGAKTLRPGKTIPVNSGYYVEVEPKSLSLRKHSV